MIQKPTKMIIGGLVAIVLISAASWIYIERTQEQVSSDAGQSLDSAITLFNLKNYADALKIFETIPSGAHREWLARYYQGSTYIMMKNYESAVTYLEQALALNPTEPRIMHGLGVAYFKLGNLKLSKAYYAKVLEVDPNDEEAKGLMDIMAKLEKRQNNLTEPESEDNIEQ